MFFVRGEYEGAKAQYQKLIDAEFTREAFMFSAISLETVLYRGLRSGARINGIDKQVFLNFIGHGGIEKLKANWIYVDPDKTKLTDRMKENAHGVTWPRIKSIMELRNSIAHGAGADSKDNLAALSAESWLAIDVFRKIIIDLEWEGPFKVLAKYRK